MTKWNAGHVASYRSKCANSTNNYAMYKYVEWQTKDKNSGLQAHRISGQ